MSSHKHIDKICVSILLFAIALTVLFMNGERFGVVIAVDEDAEAYSDSVYFTANDQDGDWDASKATAIVMDGEGCTISGQGVYAYDGNVVIAASGYYTVSGTLEDGSGNFDYQNNTYCTYIITSPLQYAVDITLNKLSSQENHDYLRFWNGHPSQDSLLAEFSGNISNPSVQHRQPVHHV